MKNIMLIVLAWIFSVQAFAQVRTAEKNNAAKIKRDSLKYALQIDSSQKVLLRDTAKLGFSTKVKGEGTLDSKNLLVDLIFKNRTKQSIRLVDLFADLSINLHVLIKYEDGSDIAPLGFGPPMISFGEHYNFKYIDIPAGGTYVKTIDLTAIIKHYNNNYLSKGKYKIRVTYFNNDGKNCVIGHFRAKEISINVTG